MAPVFAVLALLSLTLTGVYFANIRSPRSVEELQVNEAIPLAEVR
jgi:hypothetical protein